MNNNILIVDDDPELRTALCHLLGRNGYDTISCAEGHDAIDAARRAAPAVALIDLLLDDMPGIAVMKKLKDLHATVECVVMTGYGAQRSAAAAVKLGAFAFLEKPFEHEQLLVTVHSASRKQHVAQALAENEKHFRALADISSDAVYTIDHNLRMVYINATGAGLFQLDPDHLCGQHAGEVFPKEHHAILPLVLRAMDTGETFRTGESCTFPSGERCVESVLAPVRNGLGQIRSVHVLSRVAKNETPVPKGMTV